MSLSRSRFTSAPIAPIRVGLWIRIRLNLSGIRDAVNHRHIVDGTLTQTLLGIQSRVQAGQQEVNLWYLNETQPIIEGTARTRIQISAVEEALHSAISQPGNTGRALKASKQRSEVLRDRYENYTVQLESNLNALEALRLQALEALMTWDSHFDALASIYVRALSRKLKKDVRSSEAVVPTYTSIELPEISVSNSNSTNEGIPR
jgi:hypothetical protein